MKRQIVKTLSALTMILIMVLGTAAMSYAAVDTPADTTASTVTYQGGAEKFVFLPGSDKSPDDLFTNFKGVMPGDVLTQDIRISNSKDLAVKLYMRVETIDPQYERFLSQLDLKVTDENGRVLFNGKASEKDELADNVFLGLFSPDETLDLTVELKVPITMDNDFQNAYGEIVWTFLAEENQISLEGEKTWKNDKYVTEEFRPDSITVHLMQDGKPYMEDGKAVSCIVTPDKDGNWLYSFENLPKYDEEGTNYVYSVTEDPVDGYRSDHPVDEAGNEIPMDLTNTLEAYLAGSMELTKKVTLNGKPYKVTGVYYAGIFTDPDCTQPLMADVDGNEVPAVIPLSVDGTQSETVMVDGLPLGEEGKPVTYYVAETDSQGKVLEQGNEFDIHLSSKAVEVKVNDVKKVSITNDYSKKSILTGKKIWHDDDDLAGIRPDKIKVTLLQNGKVYHDPVTGEALVTTVTAEDSWTYSFVNLPEGNKDTYSVSESPVEGYSAEVEGMNIINSVDQYYYDGVIYITKKTMLRNRPYKVDEVYYAGIFTDPDCTQLLTDESGEEVIWSLMLDQESKATIPISVPSGAIDETVTYYVTEVDENGVPVNQVKGLQYTCEVKGGVCKIKNGSTADVTFINTYKTVKTPQTGDDSNLTVWILLILMTAAAAAVVWILRMKRIKPQTK